MCQDLSSGEQDGALGMPSYHHHQYHTYLTNFTDTLYLKLYLIPSLYYLKEFAEGLVTMNER